jgi:hypothetical protein
MIKKTAMLMCLFVIFNPMFVFAAAYDFPCTEAGEPTAGLTPVFRSLANRVDGLEVFPLPTITPVANVPGAYKFDHIATARQIGFINCVGLTTANDRNIAFVLTPNDEALDQAVSLSATEAQVKVVLANQTTAQEDLDNPGQYKADVTDLATAAQVSTGLANQTTITTNQAAMIANLLDLLGVGLGRSLLNATDNTFTLYNLDGSVLQVFTLSDPGGVALPRTTKREPQ